MQRALINIVKRDKVNSSEYKNIRKSGNKIIKILTKSKSRNLSKSRSENLFKSKNLIKVQNTNSIKKFDFFIFNIKIVFIKLRQILN